MSGRHALFEIGAQWFSRNRCLIWRHRSGRLMKDKVQTENGIWKREV